MLSLHLPYIGLQCLDGRGAYGGGLIAAFDDDERVAVPDGQRATQLNDVVITLAGGMPPIAYLHGRWRESSFPQLARDEDLDLVCQERSRISQWSLVGASCNLWR